MTGIPRARLVSSIEQTGLDPSAWNALACLGTNSIFQTYQWQHCWWATYGSRYEPLFVTVSNGASISGIASLMVEETPTGRTVRFVGDGRADYCDLLARDDWDTVAAIVRTLQDYGRWDVLELMNVPAASRTVEMLGSICRSAGYGVIVTEHLSCPTLLIRGCESAAHGILAKPSLRRRINGFGRAGRLAFRDLTDAVAIDAHLDAFFSQHIKRWSGHPTPSLFHEARNQLFYRELTRSMQGTGWLLFSLVELDDTPIAMHYGFDYNDAVIWYKPSFDPDFGWGSPGAVMVHHLVGRATELGRRELDFTIGDEPFKRRFTNHVRKTVRIQVFNDRARYVFERAKRSAVSLFRRTSARLKES